MIDLGKWAEENYRIASEEPVDEEDLLKAQIESDKDQKSD
jgi:endogenous inhibitor of DNA gyrase (YacG/DUF329 family)